jgi:pimeloyl-ACP methyl ester carboxylesterase
VRIWVDGVGQGPERVDPRVRELVRTMCLDTYRLDFPDAEHLGLQPPAAERLDSVRAPTLLLLGELDVSGCAAAIGFLAAGIEGSRRVDFPNATHLPNLEQPEAFNRVVLEFLAERGL